MTIERVRSSTKVFECRSLKIDRYMDIGDVLRFDDLALTADRMVVIVGEEVDHHLIAVAEQIAELVCRQKARRRQPLVDSPKVVRIRDGHLVSVDGRHPRFSSPLPVPVARPCRAVSR